MTAQSPASEADNPLAFPHPSGAQGCEGMTLRDWFAGQALVGLLGSATFSNSGGGFEQFIAERAFLLADALLTERTAHEHR